MFRVIYSVLSLYFGGSKTLSGEGAWLFSIAIQRHADEHSVCSMAFLFVSSSPGDNIQCEGIKRPQLYTDSEVFNFLAHYSGSQFALLYPRSK